jgi:hypothetical protein
MDNPVADALSQLPDQVEEIVPVSSELVVATAVPATTAGVDYNAITATAGLWSSNQ